MKKPAKGALRIEGTVAPGFESVRALYERNMRTLAERNTQLCVYYKGERVVDLWATATGDETFGADSLANVFSSSKSLAAIAISSLVGRGLLDYKERIATYWPEFAANGKEALTVADLMRHEAGLASFDTSLRREDLLAERIKQNPIGAVIEAQTPRFPEWEGRREYHAITRGWIANELFRRVDPDGRTIGEFLRAEISGPLEADAIFGVGDADWPRVSPVVPLGFLFVFLQGLIPRFLGRRMEHNILELMRRIWRLIPAIRRSTTRNAPPPLVGMSGPAGLDIFNDRTFAAGETPSANANCSARGLAKIAAMMAAGGEWAGKTILSRQSWDAIHADPVPGSMGIMGSVFSQGGVNHFVEAESDGGPADRSMNEGRSGFWGWMGLGGSIFQWHREHQIGFGYVPTSLNVLDLFNERGKGYQREVLRCVERLG